MKSMDSIKRIWSRWSSKERIALCVAGAVTFAVVLYFFLLMPALSSIRQLSVTLPRLRAQIDDMHRQQKEIAVLRKKISTGAQPIDLRALLKSSVARTSFAKSVERIDTVPGNRTFLLAAPVPFDDWIVWIADLQREFGIRLVDCRIASTNEPGLIRVEATFSAGGQPAARMTK